MCVRASILSLKFDIFQDLTTSSSSLKFDSASFHFRFLLIYFILNTIQFKPFLHTTTYWNVRTQRAHIHFGYVPQILNGDGDWKTKSQYITRGTHTHTHSITRFVFRCQKKRIKSIKSAEDDDHDEAGGGGRGERGTEKGKGQWTQWAMSNKVNKGSPRCFIFEFR